MGPESNYIDFLRANCRSPESDDPDAGARLGRALLSEGLSPGQIVELHADAVQQVVAPNDARALVAAQQLLLEVMIGYGNAQRTDAEEAKISSDAAIARELENTREAREESRRHLELLANISHELGTPLAVIQGNVAVLRKYERPANLLPSEIATTEADLDAAIERMRVLREQLMEANRTQEELVLVPLLFDRHVERAIRWAEPAAREKQLTLTLSVGCQDAMISGDEHALQSILANLLSNAVRYTREGGAITCTTTCTPATVALAVSDTGIGMSDEAKARAFDRFYRAQEARDMSAFGLGLGLPLAKRLAAAMAADITIDSQPGAGSTFSLIFPRLHATTTD